MVETDLRRVDEIGRQIFGILNAKIKVCALNGRLFCVGQALFQPYVRITTFCLR